MLTKTIEKLDKIFAVCGDWKTSKCIVHMPVAHPDRNDKKPNLTLDGVTWIEFYELYQYVKDNYDRN